jgi:hypothetical protein
MFISICRLAQPWPQKREMQNSCFSKVVDVQRSRETGFSCSVIPLPESHCSTLFTSGCKRLTEGEAFALGFWVVSFLVWEAFGREKNC